MGESIHPIVHPEKKEDQESAGLPAADIEEALDTAIETVKRKKIEWKTFFTDEECKKQKPESVSWTITRWSCK